MVNGIDQCAVVSEHLFRSCDGRKIVDGAAKDDLAQDTALKNFCSNVLAWDD